MQFPSPTSNITTAHPFISTSPAAPSAGTASARSKVARSPTAAAYYSAADLSKAREAFSLLLEISSRLLDTDSCSKPSAPLLLYLTRLCEEGWDPHLLARLVGAAFEEKEKFLAERGMAPAFKD